MELRAEVGVAGAGRCLFVSPNQWMGELRVASIAPGAPRSFQSQ